MTYHFNLSAALVMGAMLLFAVGVLAGIKLGSDDQRELDRPYVCTHLRQPTPANPLDKLCQLAPAN